MNLVTDYKCIFVNYGEVERRCIKCGYVIEKTDNDLDALTLSRMLHNGYPKPKCKLIEKKLK